VHPTHEFSLHLKRFDDQVYLTALWRRTTPVCVYQQRWRFN